MSTTGERLRHAHRLLSSRFVEVAAFRAALGGPPDDPAALMRYLELPVDRRPPLSPYFDPVFYRARHPAVGGSDLDPLLHFLETFPVLPQAPHPLVDPQDILRRLPDGLGDPPCAGRMAELLDQERAAPGPYFAADAGSLRRYLSHGINGGQRPNPWLDPRWYAERYADVPPDAYQALRHFILVGDAEGRAASAEFDGAAYLARYPDVAAASWPPLLHFLMFGAAEGRLAGPRSPPAATLQRRDAEPGAAFPIDAAGAEAARRDMQARIARVRQHRKEMVRAPSPPMFRTADARADLARLSFPRVTRPRVSVLIPVYGEFEITVECLMALAAETSDVPREVVLADDASPGGEAERFSDVAGLTVVRQRENVGFIRNCNDAFARCRGEFVLLLNNDTQVLPGAIDRLVAVLEADPSVAAAGAKLIYPDGRLQEAGCFARPDGTTGMVGLFADPSDGGYAHDRDVTYCSAAALMVRTSAVGDTLFDEAYWPAYCEDADLCLRLIAAGHRVRYVAGAVVVHHLSASTNRLSAARKHRTIVRNQQRLSERWAGLLQDLNRIQVLAFHLPQFHPTPENDLFWGPGFTEWTNVAKARPSYAGQYQPHLPGDLGFYDLRSPDALARQARLAARYGIDGFVVYHYDFGERRVLDAPIRAVLAHPELPFRWCLCWANENWTRNWDGGTRSILFEQRYDDATLDAIIDDALRQAADPRYLRVGDAPLLLVYRPLLMPDAGAFAARCRRRFDEAGFAGVHLVYVESMEAVDRRLCPADIGFDAAVEFPPHGKAVPATDERDVLKPGWAGQRFDYADTAAAFVTRDTVPYRRYPAVFPSWDNTPRQALHGHSFDGCDPDAFRVYVQEKIEEARAFLPAGARMMFVNAWNEWAEGAHLEPDAAFGHRWLEALRDALATKAIG